MSVKEETYKKVAEVLIDALGVEDDEVTPEATMIGDLGAESIDFLDIVFKLEQAFGISIDREELFPDDILTSSEYLQDGKVTADGVANLKSACRSPTSTNSKPILSSRTSPICLRFRICAVLLSTSKLKTLV